MVRKALLIGIDGYATAPLSGCINDAIAMRDALATNHDGSPNFDCRDILVRPNSQDHLTQAELRRAITALFSDQSDVALLYFSGHGFIDATGGYLVTTDAQAYAEGLAMSAVMQIANQSRAKDRIILLDCCHAGAFGSNPAMPTASEAMNEGMTIMSASRPDQAAVERDGRGAFSGLVEAALRGGASDVRGFVTPGSIYAYVDEALGAWEQRPIFKTNVSRFTILRRCPASVPEAELRRLPVLFPTDDFIFRLDPSYEPTSPPPNPEHEAVFGVLQRMRNSRIVQPVDAEHMYDAAMGSKSCRLTAFGKQYWRMAKERRL